MTQRLDARRDPTNQPTSHYPMGLDRHMGIRSFKRSASLIAASVSTFCLVSVVLSFAAVARFRYPTIVRDQWRLLSDLERLPFLQGLLVSQNGHRLVVPKLFYLFNWHVLGGSELFLVCAIALFNFTTWILVARRAWLDADAPIHLRILTLSMSLYMLFWLGNQATLHWGMALHNYLVSFGVALAVVALPPKATSARHLTRLLVVILAGLIATYSFGNGMVIWPSLLLMGWLRQLRLRDLVLLTVCGATAIGLYLVGLDRPAVDWTFSLLVDLFSFALALVGSFPAYLSQPLVGWQTSLMWRLALLCGLAVSLFLAFELWKMKRQPTQPPPFRTIAFGVAVYVLLSALMIGVARVGTYGPRSALAPRYLMWSTLLWSTLLLRTTLRTTSLPQRSFTGARVLISAAVFAGLTVGQWHWTEHIARAHSQALPLRALLLSGAHDDSLARRLFKNTELVYRLRTHLYENRWAPFRQQRSRLIGTALEDPVKLPQCAGGVSRTQLLRSEQGRNHYRLDGWVSSDTGGTTAKALLVLDADNIVCGYGEASPIRLRNPRVSPPNKRNLPWPLSKAQRFSTYLGNGPAWVAYAVSTPDNPTLSIVAGAHSSRACLLDQVMLQTRRQPPEEAPPLFEDTFESGDLSLWGAPGAPSKAQTPSHSTTGSDPRSSLSQPR